MRLRRILLEDINLKDERFRILHFCSPDQLTQSIREVGLIYPPVVTPRNGLLVPVTGWKRIFACKQLLLSPIPVFVSGETDDLKTFRMALFENLAIRKFDLIERAEIVNRLKKFGENKKRIMKEYFPLFGIPPIHDSYDLYTKISRMNRKEKRLVSEKEIALPVVEQLIQLSSKERALFFPLIVILSRNKQREMLELAREISLKKEKPIQEIFYSDEMQNVLLNEKYSPLQKADRVRLLLKKQRFPRLLSQERFFESSKKKLGWPQDIDLFPTPNFEDNEVHIKFSFTGKKDYLTKLSSLRRMAEKDEFAAFLESSSDE